MHRDDPAHMSIDDRQETAWPLRRGLRRGLAVGQQGPALEADRLEDAGQRRGRADGTRTTPHSFLD